MHLKLNLFYLAAQKQMKKCSSTSIPVETDTVERSLQIGLLGAWFDENVTMKVHVMKKCSIAMWNLSKHKKIRKYLDTDTCTIVVDALVTSHLDYCNSLLFGISEYLLHRLQIVQNYPAKLVLNRKRYESATQCLIDLHWLPIKARIDYKIILIVFKCLHSMGPSYLTNLLIKEENRPGLRSGKTGLKLKIPSVKNKTFAARSFGVIGPKLWNKIPDSLKTINSCETFKVELKTFLFKKYLLNESDFIYY